MKKLYIELDCQVENFDGMDSLLGESLLGGNECSGHICSGSAWLQKGLDKLQEIALLGIDTEIDCSCELLFVDDAEIQALNVETRGIDKVNDVLSYPTVEGIKDIKLTRQAFFTDMEGDRLSIGSIVISLPQMQRQAREYGNSIERELFYLIVHGVCHLLGYDHMVEQEKAEMRRQEEIILQAMGYGLQE